MRRLLIVAVIVLGSTPFCQAQVELKDYADANGYFDV